MLYGDKALDDIFDDSYYIVYCRLDKKKTPYDLVWEDNEFLSGKVLQLARSCCSFL